MQSEQRDVRTDAAELRAALEQVYWIGGGSGAGKSTIARRIAERNALRLYSTDDAMSDHAERSHPRTSPYLHQFAAMDMDQRWVERTPAAMLETFHWFQGEGFELIVEDLVGQPQAPPTIIEGFRLLPSLVKPLITELSHAVWLLPTPEFRKAAFTSRGSLWRIAGRTSDPQRALDNLLARDRMFTDRVREETKHLGLHAIEIDSTMTVDDLDVILAGLFGLD